MARLDRVPGVKEVAQVAACIGREFAYSLLTAVSASPEAELQAALDRLVAAELVFSRGTPPEASYSFKHALVRDAAHESMLKAQRQHVHGLIARVLETRFPETVETEPELLAQHCTEAGLVEQAVEYWQRAGQQALARSATAEAVAHLHRGLELLEGLPDGPERRRRELGLQLGLGPALVAAKGFAAPETGRAYARACELCRELDDTSKLLPALYGQSAVHWQRAELAAAHAEARELLGLAEEQGDAAAVVVGIVSSGPTCSSSGGSLRPRPLRERARPLRSRAGPELALHLRHRLARRSACSGSPTRSSPSATRSKPGCRQGEALASARKLAHPNTIAEALFCDWVLHQAPPQRPRGPGAG